MPAPEILQTKIFIPPPRTDRVLRPRLIEHLNSGYHRKLSLISAPAGFGKTTLLSEWAHILRQDSARSGSNKNQVSWLSLDEADNDPARFLTYFIASLKQIEEMGATFGDSALNVLQFPQPPDINSILTILINEIVALDDNLILILDDYHRIDSPTIDAALAFLLDHLPPRFHLVIATRSDPQLPLARVRARDQLTELRAADLRFTPSEADEFLNRIMDLNLSMEHIAALDTRTEGWIAGLQLAAISMRGQEDTAGFIQSFKGSHHMILDYLLEEVLESQPEQLQSFLLQTSILDQLSGALCDATTGLENSQEILEDLVQNNLFIVPLDNDRCWYRYHHLFADLLLQRNRLEQAATIDNLHARAAEWFRQQGFHRDAIRHLIAAKDYKTAANLIKDIAIDIMQQGEHATVTRWINALPEQVIKEQPYLCVIQARALLLTGQVEAAEARLITAEAGLEIIKKQHSDVDSLLGLIHSNRAYLTFMLGKHDQTISNAQKALNLLPETILSYRAQTALYLGVAYRYNGQHRAALKLYNELSPTIQSMGGNVSGVLYFLQLGELYSELGQLHRAKEIFEQALIYTEQHFGRPDMPFSGYVYVSIGRILRQWDQLDEAYRYAKKGIDLCQKWDVAEILALSSIELSHIHHALNNDQQARESIQAAIQNLNSFSPWGRQYAESHQAILNLKRDDRASAERWARTLDLDIDGKFEFHREIEYLALARVYLAKELFDDARSLIVRINRIARDSGKKQTELESLILLALVAFAQSETDQALSHLEEAFAISEPEGYIRIYMDEGPPMARLLEQAHSHGMAKAYVRRLLSAFSSDKREPSEDTTSKVHPSDLIEPLSNREIEVLQQIADGLTNQAIANRLYLSINTIKVHTRNIYGKLGVSNRLQAVSRANELGILPPS